MSTRGPDQASRLVALAQDLQLWHTPDGIGFATFRVNGHDEHWSLRSRTFKSFLQRAFYRAEGMSASSEPLNSALGVLEGMALHEGREHVTQARLAGASDAHPGLSYLDLANEAWEAVEIDPSGWRVVPSEVCPVRFLRCKGMRPMPEPERGGSLEELRPFLNVEDDDDFVLVIGWLVGALRAAGPYPILNLHGEQGSGKTEQARLLRALIDPNAAPVRAEPKDGRDLMVAARNGWVIALDNLSHLSPWLSDALCRLSTGGGFSTRSLYTDDQEMIFDAQRPMILTGINEIATRGDLLDRSIGLTLPRIPDNRRRPESDLWGDFEAVRPRILGALLDAVAAGMRNERHVRLDRHPRMADFARWVAAAEEELPWQEGTFLRAYTSNRASANETALEASPVAAEVLRLVANCEAWQGPAAELLRVLEKRADEKVVKGQTWPKNPRALSAALRRLAPNLRADGTSVEFFEDSRPKQIRLGRDSCDGCDASDGAGSAKAENAPEPSQIGLELSQPASLGGTPVSRNLNEYGIGVATPATVANSAALEELF